MNAGEMSDHEVQTRYQLAWRMVFGYSFDYRERDQLMTLYGNELVARGYSLADLHIR